jgi:hypothetical protein
MKKLIGLIVLGSSLTVSAVEMVTPVKTSGTTLTKVSDQEFESAWSGLACIKKGGSMIKVSPSFAQAGLKYADCSNSPAAKELARVMGKGEVRVFKLAELPENVIKQALGIN